MASDVMNFISGMQSRIQQYCGIKMNMMIHRDTEPREDYGEELVSNLDDEAKKDAFSILRQQLCPGPTS
eukprot:3983512-Ditylum_brightwellii.AAC.1